MTSKRKPPKQFGAPLGPNDPGFYGNASVDVPMLPPTMDTMGRPLPPTTEEEAP